MTVQALVDEARRVQARDVERHAWMAHLVIVGIGWATVELDRAERELAPLRCTGWDDAQRDELLGATVRRCRDEAPRLLLLEPDTEGRLAAFLVRFGEGVGAVYLGDPVRPAAKDPTPLPLPADLRAFEPRDHGTLGRRSAGTLGPRGPGPLGPGRVLLGGPAWGPHIVVLEPESSS
jgi:hypothetical protein